MIEDVEDGARYALTVDGRDFLSEERTVTGAQVAEMAGLPAGGEVVLVSIARGGASRIGVADRISLDQGAAEVRSGRADRPWGLFVDGRRWDWIAPSILESEVREIGMIPEGRSIFVEGEADPVRTGGLIDLTGGTPRVVTRSAVLVPQRQVVPVIVNGRARELADPDATFEDLVRLAFPDLPVAVGRTFTVTYRRGGAVRPEGSLVPRQATRLAPGAVINVSATDKS